MLLSISLQQSICTKTKETKFIYSFILFVAGKVVTYFFIEKLKPSERRVMPQPIRKKRKRCNNMSCYSLESHLNNFPLWYRYLVWLLWIQPDLIDWYPTFEVSKFWKSALTLWLFKTLLKISTFDSHRLFLAFTFYFFGFVILIYYIFTVDLSSFQTIIIQLPDTMMKNIKYFLCCQTKT